LHRNQHKRKPVCVAFCHFTADVGGGSDLSLFDLVTHLPNDRFRPFMILKTGDPMTDRYTAAGIDVIQVRLVPPRKALEVRRLLRYLFWFWPSVIGVLHAIRKSRADIVHVNTLYNLQGAMAAKLARRPLVWHVREADLDSVPARLIKMFVRLLADRVVAISSSVAAKLRGCGDRLHVIHNGIDMTKYEGLPDRHEARQLLGLESEVPVIATIGRLEPWKGQHVLIEAVPSILERYPDTTVLVVGSPAANKPEYAADLQSRCEELGIAQHVLFTGRRDDVPTILAASDALVLPSVSPEPFGRTIVEAMAARRPVIATAAGGPLDIIVDGNTGWFIPPNDSDAITSRVHDVFSDAGRADTMGELGLRRAHELFSLDRLVNDMGRLFEGIYAHRRRGIA